MNRLRALWSSLSPIKRAAAIGCSVVALFIIIQLLTVIKGVRWWESGYYEYPVWSPGGERVLYLFGERAAEGRQLVITRRPGNLLSPFTLRRITLPEQQLSVPAWRSEDEVSVFTRRGSISITGSGWLAYRAHLYLYNLRTDSYRVVEAPLSGPEGAAWHPSGSYALFSMSEWDEEGRAGIYKFRPDEGVFVLWREATLPSSIAFSPDGEQVAYLDLIEVEGQKRTHLIVAETATRKVKVFKQLGDTTDTERWEVFNDTGLSWSADGSLFLMMGTRMTNRQSLFYNVQKGFFCMGIEGHGDLTFSPRSSSLDFFDWSPDGSTVVASTVPRPFIGKNTLRTVTPPRECSN